MKTGSSVMRCVLGRAVCCLLGAPGLLTATETLELSPFSCCDGEFATTTAGGRAVWQNTGGDAYLYFNVPASFVFTPGSSLYVRIVYYDLGFGTVSLQYDSTQGNSLPDFYVRSETHTRSSRVNTGTFATNYHELLQPSLSGRQNGGADFRLALSSGGGVPLSVARVTLQNRAFDDPDFQYVLSRPWLRPYTGPSREDVDRSTLRDKVMTGYQGWFRTPNDLADRGWSHWVRGGEMAPENFTIDMWPELTGSGASELFPAGEVKTRSGRPAHVFSSTTRETVWRHFEWMRQYNIDGVFLQRFATRNNSGAYGADEWVLHHVREAAHRSGRLWAIEYDISALDDAEALEVLTNDWRWLVDVVGVRNDSRYAWEDGRPVVFIWGLPFPDREISQPTGNAIVDFFKNDPVYGGNYVIGGIPWWWRSMTDWYGHFRRYDGALAWMPQDAAGYTADFQQLNSWGIDYFPHVWPGFSWAHLQRLAGESQYTPRAGGAFYWQKIREALDSGASRLFLGMFDEYDEGTAIMPMTDDPPHPEPNYGRFLTNLGRPADWWLLLSGEARDLLLRHRPFSPAMPTEAELANRANIGPEAWIDLGSTDRMEGLYRVDVADGDTSPGTVAGRDCRFNIDPASDRYFYFNVEDAFAHGSAAGLDVTIDLEYLDRDGNVPLTLQYDSVQGPYTAHPKTIVTRGSGLWRTARFNLADAHFGNRQNNGADFRLAVGAGLPVHLDRVWVRLPGERSIPPAATLLVPAGASWRFLADGTDQGAAWRSASYDDRAWPSGLAQLGYGDGDEKTLVGFGPDPNNRHVTTYFRHTFHVPEPGQFVTLTLGVVRDDGAVIYLNGQEIYRGGMPSGALTYSTLATDRVGGYDESAFFEQNVDPALLVPGANVLAAEIHQQARDSSDLSFDLVLAGVTMTNLPPGVVLTEPADGTEFAAPSRILLKAIASAGGTATVARVEFLAGTNRLGQAPNAPYQWTWNNPPLGDHLLQARALLDTGAILSSAGAMVRVKPLVVSTTLVERGSVWKYLDDGSNQGSAWRGTNFNDSAWPSGPARLGYGGDGEVTLLDFGPDPTAKHIAYYFRRWFDAPAPPAITNLTLSLQRDDGAVIYLNGFEVLRSNMPGGGVGFLTTASSAVSGAEEETFFEASIPPTWLRAGSNLLAVQVHQSSGASSDLGFDLELVGTGPPPAPPALTVSRAGLNVVVSWASPVSGFRLESARRLGPGQAWSPAGAVVTTNDNGVVAIVPIASEQEFFRLSNP